MSRLAIMGSKAFTNSGLMNGLLDIYLFEDPDLEIATYNHEDWGVESMAVCWAIENGVDFKFYVAYEQLKQTCDPIIKTATDLVCDSDEVLIFWDGTDEVIESVFDIARGQEKTQLIIISNEDVDCEVYGPSE
jgi:hypothetical protein